MWPVFSRLDRIPHRRSNPVVRRQHREEKFMILTWGGGGGIFLKNDSERERRMEWAFLLKMKASLLLYCTLSRCQSSWQISNLFRFRNQHSCVYKKTFLVLFPFFFFFSSFFFLPAPAPAQDDTPPPNLTSSSPLAARRS